MFIFDKNIFEIIMMVSFGFSWPFSIYKSYTSRSTKGKSILFLYIVLVGYAAGVLHKTFYSRDFVIIFYINNFFLVAIDIILFYRNLWIEKQVVVN